MEDGGNASQETQNDVEEEIRRSTFREVSLWVVCRGHVCVGLPRLTHTPKGGQKIHRKPRVAFEKPSKCAPISKGEQHSIAPITMSDQTKKPAREKIMAIGSMFK